MIYVINLVQLLTAQNQKAYPQVGNQAPGCGFPIAKILVMFSLATGAAMGVLIDVFNTSDVTMARKMYSLLNTGDVALADRAFGTYVDLVFVQTQGAEAVFRKHQSRNSDFRRGKRLGVDDHIVVWYKPQRCPKNLPLQEFDKLPSSISGFGSTFLYSTKGLSYQSRDCCHNFTESKNLHQSSASTIVPTAVGSGSRSAPCQDDFGHGALKRENSFYGTPRNLCALDVSIKYALLRGRKLGKIRRWKTATKK